MGLIEEQYQSALDEIYSSYMEVKTLVKNKLDSEIRHPHILVNLAKELGLLPDPHKIIRVTGSKGKGTTTRMICWAAIQSKKFSKVGALISPEEIDHYDRIRINMNPVSKARFVANYLFLRPFLFKILEDQRQENPLFYLSPSGIFLLLGLKYFKDEGVDFFVLEGGRGARFDEVGQIESEISAITSLFLEHPESLGPSIDQVWWNKSFYFHNSQRVILGPSCLPHLAKLESDFRIKARSVDSLHIKSQGWYMELLQISQQIADELGWDVDMSTAPQLSASKGAFQFQNCTIHFEALISAESIFIEQMKTFLEKQKIEIVYLCIPDNKDLFEIAKIVSHIGVPFQLIQLSGIRGYLDFENYQHFPHKIHRFDYQNPAQFKKWVQNLRSQSILFWGTQSFIRFLKFTMRS